MRGLLGSTLALGIALAVSAPAAAATNIVVNGGFEDPVITGPTSGSGYQQFNSPSPAITGYNVTGGSVDLIKAPYAVNSPNQALDLVGEDPGTITQMLNTVVGQIYSLTFAYSHNSASDPNFLYSANVSIGNLSTNFFHTGAATSFSTFSGFFTATTNNVLTFTSGPESANGGIVIDDISVVAAPEPATWAMMLLGFGLVGWSLRRRPRRSAAFA